MTSPSLLDKMTPSMNFKENLEQYLPSHEVEQILSSLAEESVHALYLDTRKISDEDFLSRFPHAKAHPFVPHAYFYQKSEYDFGKSILQDAGAIYISDPAAMMVPYLLSPKPGEWVLDLCAAPGGKSCGSSLLMEQKGVLVANDVSFPRARELSRNVERMGLGNVVVSSSDFSFCSEYFQGLFDKILVDAPCSGSAMFRKNEAEKEDWSYEKVRSLAKKQKALLQMAYQMLAPGGTLAYSTCSFSKEEDEDVVKSLLLEEESASILPIPDSPLFYPSEKVPGTIHLFPNRFEGEGQYIALIHKAGTLPVHEPQFVKNMNYRVFLRKYGLFERSNEAMREKFYSMSERFDVSHLNILRYGVKLFELRDVVFLPDHHLSHFLPSSYSVPLSEKNAKAYLAGETFPIDLPDDYYIVSYQGLNLGWIKATKEVAKNHYPKGLRHK